MSINVVEDDTLLVPGNCGPQRTPALSPRVAELAEALDWQDAADPDVWGCHVGRTDVPLLHTLSWDTLDEFLKEDVWLAPLNEREDQDDAWGEGPQAANLFLIDELAGDGQFFFLTPAGRPYRKYAASGSATIAWSMADQMAAGKEFFFRANDLITTYQDEVESLGYEWKSSGVWSPPYDLSDPAEPDYEGKTRDAVYADGDGVIEVVLEHISYLGTWTDQPQVFALAWLAYVCSVDRCRLAANTGVGKDWIGAALDEDDVSAALTTRWGAGPDDLYWKGAEAFYQWKKLLGEVDDLKLPRAFHQLVLRDPENPLSVFLRPERPVYETKNVSNTLLRHLKSAGLGSEVITPHKLRLRDAAYYSRRDPGRPVWRPIPQRMKELGIPRSNPARQGRRLVVSVAPDGTIVGDIHRERRR